MQGEEQQGQGLEMGHLTCVAEREKLEASEQGGEGWEVRRERWAGPEVEGF